MSEPIYFDELEIGQSWVSPARTVTETDVVNFANMTGDIDPLHVNHDYASKSHFGQPVAHGLLGVSWVAGLAIHNPMIKTAAFTSIENWEFLAPIYFGDTLHVQTSVLEMENNGRRNGKVRWQKKLINQNDKVVQQGVFITIVQKRVAVPTPHLNKSGSESSAAADSGSSAGS